MICLPAAKLVSLSFLHSCLLCQMLTHPAVLLFLLLPSWFLIFAAILLLSLQYLLLLPCILIFEEKKKVWPLQKILC